MQTEHKPTQPNPSIRKKILLQGLGAPSNTKNAHLFAKNLDV